jgi:hypothetical protein
LAGEIRRTVPDAWHSRHVAQLLAWANEYRDLLGTDHPLTAYAGRHQQHRAVQS